MTRQTERPGRATHAALAVTLAASIAGCAFSNIDLVQDHRVAMVTPANYATVRLPVTVSWRTHGLQQTIDGQPVLFAVFVDRRVIAPGAALRSIANGDRNCRAAQGCPSPDYYKAHGVYVVTGTSLTLPFLPDLRDPAAGIRHDTHTVTVVILRGDRRDGESAFSTSFTIDRGGTKT